MKIKVFAIITTQFVRSLIILLLGVSNSLAGGNFDLESGIIEYDAYFDASGWKSSGKVTMYFDKSGAYKANIRESTDSDGKVTNRWDITIEDIAYEIDMDKKIGTKSDLRLARKLVSDIDLTQITEEDIEKYELKRVGTEEILGRECEVWVSEKLKSKVWIWKGLTLKAENYDFLGFPVEASMVATKLEENVPISPETFTVPADVVIEDEGDLILESLKKVKEAGGDFQGMLETMKKNNQMTDEEVQEILKELEQN